MATRDSLKAGVASDRANHLLANARELRVIGAGDHQHRHVELVQLIPQGKLGSGATVAQGARKSVGPIFESLGSTRLLGVEPGEQWPGKPVVKEGPDTD